MTSSERVRKAFTHKFPDRTPIFEYVIASERISSLVLGRQASFLHWDKVLREKGWKQAIRQLALDRIDIAMSLGHDLLYQSPIAPPRKPALSQASKIREDDPVGKVRERNARKKESPQTFDEDSLLIFSTLKDEMRKRDISLPILAPAYAHGIWTDIDLMQTMILEPQIAHEHFSLASESCERSIESYAKIGIEIVGIGGDFAGNSPLISPECYRKFIMPELRKLSSRIHATGAFAVNASDGNLWSMIEEFLNGTSVDGYLEIDSHAGMDLKRLKTAFGKSFCFLGNIDCGNILSFAKPETIRMTVLKCIEDGLGDGGGHIFTASNAITDSVPPENYLSMANAYREYFELKPLSLHCGEKTATVAF